MEPGTSGCICRGSIFSRPPLPRTPPAPTEGAAADHLETSLIWLSPLHPHSTPNLGSPHLLREKGSEANAYKEKKSTPTPDPPGTLGFHPAPFSPVSQLEVFLLPLPLCWWPHSHLIWSPDSTSPYPRHFLFLTSTLNLPSRVSHTPVSSPHFCLLRGPASNSNFTHCRQNLSSLYSLPTTHLCS